MPYTLCVGVQTPVLFPMVGMVIKLIVFFVYPLFEFPIKKMGWPSPNIRSWSTQQHIFVITMYVVKIGIIPPEGSNCYVSTNSWTLLCWEFSEVEPTKISRRRRSWGQNVDPFLPSCGFLEAEMPTPGKRKKVDLTGPTWEESSSCIGWTVLRDFAFRVGFDLQDFCRSVSPGVLGLKFTCEIQRPYRDPNHRTSEDYWSVQSPPKCKVFRFHETFSAGDWIPRDIIYIYICYDMHILRPCESDMAQWVVLSCDDGPLPCDTTSVFGTFDRSQITRWGAWVRMFPLSQEDFLHTPVASPPLTLEDI